MSEPELPLRLMEEERALESVDDDSRDSSFDCAGSGHQVSRNGPIFDVLSVSIALS